MTRKVKWRVGDPSFATDIHVLAIASYTRAIAARSQEIGINWLKMTAYIPAIAADSRAIGIYIEVIAPRSPENPIYIQEIAADIEEMAANKAEIGIYSPGTATSSRKTLKNSRFIGISPELPYSTQTSRPAIHPTPVHQMEARPGIQVEIMP